MEFTRIDGGVCAAKGFQANGLNCGLNPDRNKNDLGMIFSTEICNAAAVYTTNKVKGAPILVTKKHLETTGKKARAVIVNSKNANTCNADGEEKAQKMCELAAKELGISADEVIVASTGVIGQILPIEPIADHVKELAAGLAPENHDKAANAIMTTDTFPKEVAVQFTLDGKTCTVGGMAKGSGMIHPNMATTLNFVTTDVAISSELIQKALSEIVKVTYNCLSIDGDTSTNDMVSIMANGLAGNTEISEENEEYEIFRKALYEVLMNMTKMLAKDGEGASKMLECTVSGAPDQDTAIIVAKSVIRSPLFKCAMFGEDANWGRILCAVGYADADFDITKVGVDLASAKGSIAVCRNGSGVEFSEDEAKVILGEDEIYINIDLGQGEASAKAWGCDLTYDYVKINGDYRS
ncbi:bifunctional glutamate N-acetyltransferase/amino-acid acetyltransferase ArgJ [Roseburia sp. MUC/MUC-530-WT-4D]|uniref:Arginine biosynthesis bifunctional protein ArgJ n=1 Tax=Roseburia porci TaxID=2605790 RepID=A0A6L5YU51_9FIRM|nr:bifunctional glutamate N-acetyltransferase/amino-acid acetyltransferase ArgJ [Roseburia porci]